jgi:hypothetical protein
MGTLSEEWDSDFERVQYEKVELKIRIQQMVLPGSDPPILVAKLPLEDNFWLEVYSTDWFAIMRPDGTCMYGDEITRYINFHKVGAHKKHPNSSK